MRDFGLLSRQDFQDDGPALKNLNNQWEFFADGIAEFEGAYPEKGDILVQLARVGSAHSFVNSFRD